MEPEMRTKDDERQRSGTDHWGSMPIRSGGRAQQPDQETHRVDVELEGDPEGVVEEMPREKWNVLEAVGRTACNLPGQGGEECSNISIQLMQGDLMRHQKSDESRRSMGAWSIWHSRRMDDDGSRSHRRGAPGGGEHEWTEGTTSRCDHRTASRPRAGQGGEEDRA